MADNNTSKSTASIGCGGLLSTLLTVLFVWMKLTDQIDWSWLWVLSPLWIPLVLATAVFIVIMLVILILK